MRRLRFLAAHLGAFHLKNMTAEPVSPRGDGEGDPLRQIRLNGNEVVNFGSGNYLGLDRHPAVTEAAIEGLRRLGHHPGSSRIFYSQENCLLLERELADLVGAEASMVCVNVAQTHQGAIPALFGDKSSTIFVDRYAHTTLYLAAMIAKSRGARVVTVDTRDEEELRCKMLRERRANNVLLIDGVYSMQGELPRIPALQALCDELKAVLYIDDAHGIGILGESGGGVAELFKLSYDNLIVVGSLQKGLACFGGFVAARAEVIEFLRMTSTSYIFSGPLQPHTVESVRAAVRICRSDEGRDLRSLLLEKSARIRHSLREMGYRVDEHPTPIIAVPIGGDVDTMMAGRKIFDQGVFVNSVVFPAVPKGEGILRITINSIHTEAEIARLLEAFSELRRYRTERGGRIRRSLHHFTEMVKARVMGEAYTGLR